MSNVKSVTLCNYYDTERKIPINVVARFSTDFGDLNKYADYATYLSKDGSGLFLKDIPHLKLCDARNKNKSICDLYAGVELDKKKAWDELFKNINGAKSAIYFGNFDFDDVCKIHELSFISQSVNCNRLNDQGIARFLDKFINRPYDLDDSELYAKSQAEIIEENSPYWNKLIVALGLDVESCTKNDNGFREVSNGDIAFLSKLEERFTAHKNEPKEVNLMCDDAVLQGKKGGVFADIFKRDSGSLEMVI